MQITEMKIEDIPRVTELAVQLGYSNTILAIQSRFEKLAKLPEYGFFVAKDEGGEAIGWVQVSEEAQSLLIEPLIEIAALVVDQAQRSKGIGSLLVT
jgi:predicted N-acetyltransferase YhbS